MRLCVGVVLSCLASMMAVAEGDKLAPNDWLLNADNDRQRFELLQDYTGGFSSAMWEVGERYRVLHQALERENYDLALYHWEKIQAAIKNGYLKRPGRKANSDALFLDSVWGEVKAAIASGDADRAWQGFDQARTACMVCHAAESVGFMNNQPLFDLTPVRPE